MIRLLFAGETEEVREQILSTTLDGEQKAAVTSPSGGKEISGALLLEQHPRCVRGLKEAAVDILGHRLTGNDIDAETRFLPLFEEVGSELLSFDPDPFRRFVAAAQSFHLITPRGLHLRRYFEAVSLARSDRFAEALDALDRLLGEEVDGEIRVRAINSRAIYAYILGRLGEARSGFLEAMTLWQSAGNPVRQAMALLNLGALSHHLQQYEEADSYLNEALALFSDAEAATWIASTHNNLGLVHRDLGNWKEAQVHLRAAAAHYEEVDASDLLGRALNNLGEIALFQGGLAEAESNFSRALKALESRLFRIDAHLHRGLAFQAGERLNDARRSFESAYEDALSIGRKDILALVQYRLGDLFRRQGEAKRATELWLEALDVVESVRQPLQDESLRIALLGRWQQIYEALVVHLIENGASEQAFFWSERSRSRAFAEALDKNRSLSPGLSRYLQEGATVADVQSLLAENETLHIYFTCGVLDRSEPFVATLAADSPVGRLLRIPPRTYLFRLTRDQFQVIHCDLDPNLLASDSPRADSRRFLDGATLREIGRRLQIGENDSPDKETLILCPHGSLHQVPFQALPVDEGTSGRKRSYIPSATVLVGERRRQWAFPASTERSLVIGYEGEREPKLRFAEREADRIATLTHGTHWVDPGQDLGLLARRAGQVRWLHFACHASFDYAAPLDSYLEIGPGVRITAYDILETWRLQARLVTLSACSSGVSRILRSDEPMGLIRSFLFAGARGVIATQWPVEDLPTYLLMERFYQILNRAPDEPAASLVTAQNWLRTVERKTLIPILETRMAVPDGAGELPDGERPFAEPRFWAGFLYYGS